ncbi:hypothetical protein [Saccharopolyspora sp. NPDC049426]|uniref:hypothetical protein n=1 Tax=Saccharopolyspora sp. NPDC049426 TaxID=3155652 RepID=UPI00341B182B
MTDPGMYGDYGSMKSAEGCIREAAESLGKNLQDFHTRAQLDSAIPSLSGNKIPITTTAPFGPNIDEIETLMAQSVQAAYKPTVDAVDEFLKETRKQVDNLAIGISESIAEYQRRDNEAASGMPNVHPPR